MEIDVEALRALLVVLEQGSITKAARILNLSRSAVSWRMKRLEELVGQELIVRDGRSLRPSRAARAILDDARTLVETHDRIVQRLGSADLTGHVTVGADNDVDVAQLTRILGSFGRVHPGVEVSLMVDRGRHILEGVDVGDVDLVLTQVTDDHLRPDDRVLWTDALIWAVSRAWPYDDGGVVPLVTFGKDCPFRALSEPDLRAGGIDYRVALSVPTTAGVVSSVEDGLGVAVIPEYCLTDRLSIWGPSADLPTLPPVHAIVRRSPKDSSETVQLLADLITTELAVAAEGQGQQLMPVA